MKIGDIVQSASWTPIAPCHGIVLKVTKSCGDLAGMVLVQWFGIFGDRVQLHNPRDLVSL